MRPRTLSTIGMLSAGFFLAASTVFAQAQQQNRIGPPDETELTPEVCFFTETDFGGRFFCELGYRTVNSVDPRWRDSIKSIEVRDGASVQVCNQFNRGGDCQSITKNVRELGPTLFNHVYSYRTEE